MPACTPPVQPAHSCMHCHIISGGGCIFSAIYLHTLDVDDCKCHLYLDLTLSVTVYIHRWELGQYNLFPFHVTHHKIPIPKVTFACCFASPWLKRLLLFCFAEWGEHPQKDMEQAISVVSKVEPLNSSENLVPRRGHWKARPSQGKRQIGPAPLQFSAAFAALCA